MFHKIDLTAYSFDSLPAVFARLDRHKGTVRPFYRLPLFNESMRVFSNFGRKVALLYGTAITGTQGRNDRVSYASKVPIRAYATHQHITVWKEAA